MASLDPSDNYAILINTFMVRPEQADELLRVLTEATNTMNHLPGFISANLHLSHDRTRVVNYAQWRSKADFKSMLQNPQAQPHMKAAAELAESFEPILYSLEFSGH